MNTIPLTQGLVAIVDDEDFAELSQHNWCAANGYALRRVMVAGVSHTVFMHRYLMAPPDGMFVDHINGNRADNRRENLRVVTKLQNCHNMRSSRNQKKGKFKGVSWYPGKGGGRWRAWIRVPGAKPQGRSKYLGSFGSADQAALAYDKAARELFGEFAACNFEGT
jgi:hypothetical protein